jgi:hypothetical protein
VQLGSLADVLALRDWLSSAWDYMAMGDFPYPSSYMLNGNGQLPAYPVKVACAHLAREGLQAEELLPGGAGRGGAGRGGALAVPAAQLLLGGARVAGRCGRMPCGHCISPAPARASGLAGWWWGVRWGACAAVVAT